MTIAKLIVEVAANVSALQRDLRRSQKFIDDFARHVERGMSSSTLLAGFGKRGLSSIRELTGGIIKEFDSAAAEIRDKLSRGLIDPKRAALEMQRATHTMMQQVEGSLGRTDVGREIRRIFERAGQDAGLGFQRRFSPQTRAAAIIRDLDRGFQRDIGRAREGLARGLINPQEFRLLSALAANEFNQGLVAGIDRLARSGRMTDALRQEMAAFTKAQGPRVFDQEAARQLREQVRQQAELQRMGRLHNAALVEDARRAARAQSDAQSMGRIHARAIAEDLARTQAIGRRETAAYAEDVRRSARAHDEARRMALVHAEALREHARRTEESRNRVTGYITSLRDFGSQLTRTVTIPILAAGAGAVKFAAEAEIARTRLDVVFGPQGAGVMVATLRELQGQIPASTREIHNFAASFGEMLIPLGIAPKRAREMSTELILIAKNISLVQKVPAERAFSALRSALVSQTRELRKLGVNVTEADIKREAFAQGWLKAGEQLGVTGRALAAFNVIVNRSALLAKANETASQTFALRLLFLKARAEDAAAALGRELLPILIPLIESATRLAQRIQTLDGAKVRLVIRIAALIAIIGPLIVIVGNLTLAIRGLAAMFVLLGGANILAALALLGAAAAVLYEISRAARDAAEQMNAFRDSVANVSEKTATDMIAGLDRQIEHFQSIITNLERQKDVGRPEFQGETFVTVKGLTAEQQKQLDQANEYIAILKEQRRVVDDRRKSLERTRKEEELFQNKLDQFKQSLSETPIGADPFKQLKEDVGAVIRRMEIVAESVGRESKAMNVPLEAALAMYDELLLKIEQHGGLQKAPVDLLELQLRLLKEINEQLDKTDFARTFPDLAKSLKGVGEQARIAAAQLEIAKRRGTGVAEATRAHEEAQRAVGAIQQEILAAMERMGLPVARQVELWNQVKEILSDLGVPIEDTTEKVSRLTALLRSIAVAARGILNIADAFGEVSDELRDVLEGVSGIAEGLEAARKAQQAIKASKAAGKGAGLQDILAMAGGIVGIIGGVASVLGGLFGKSDEEKQREQERANILRENNQRLSDLVASMRGMTGEIKNLVDTRAALAFTQSPGFVQTANLVGPNRLTMLMISQFGLTLRDLDRIAAEVGVTIRNSAGQIVPEALQQLYDALLLAAEAATRFHDNLEHRRRRLELRADIEDVEDTPVAKINRELQLLSEFGLPIFEQFFAGIDTTTAEGQAQLENALRALFDALESGALPLEAFGRLNLDELLDIIMGVEGALDQLREQANSLTDALKNVPTGFKVALARFDAAAAEVAAIASGRMPGAARGPLDGIRYPESRPLPPVTIENVNIDAGTRNGRQIWEEIKQAARDESRRTTGRTTQPFQNIA